MIFDHPIYPITNTRLSGLSHADQARVFAEQGVALIQIREKSLTSRAFYKAASAAVEATKGTRSKLIVNDRVDIAMAVGADGVHLGQEDLRPGYARDLLGANVLIGYSTHTIDQVREALEMPVDYIAFGPIFGTSTKEDPDPPTGIEALKKVKELAGPVPVVAIGGINKENIAEVKESGVNAAALIGALYAGENEIQNNVSELTSKWSDKNV